MNDKIFNGNDIYEVAIIYAEYEKAHIFLEEALKDMKLSNEHLDKVIDRYKNGDCDILKHFLPWNIIATKEQYNNLVQNNNLTSPELMKELNIPLDNNYFLVCIKVGQYPIDGISKKDKIKLNLEEKKLMNKYIFNYVYCKSDIIALKKIFDLTFDDECLLDFCKNYNSITILGYLIDHGIKPTVECLYHLIPKYCKHQKVHSILEKSL
jgi:hypothetical protein